MSKSTRPPQIGERVRVRVLVGKVRRPERPGAPALTTDPAGEEIRWSGFYARRLAAGEIEIITAETP